MKPTVIRKKKASLWSRNAKKRRSLVKKAFGFTPVGLALKNRKKIGRFGKKAFGFTPVGLALKNRKKIGRFSYNFV